MSRKGRGRGVTWELYPRLKEHRGQGCDLGTKPPSAGEQGARGMAVVWGLLPHLDEHEGQGQGGDLGVAGGVALRQLLHGLPPVAAHQRPVRHLLLCQLLQVSGVEQHWRCSCFLCCTAKIGWGVGRGGVAIGQQSKLSCREA